MPQLNENEVYARHSELLKEAVSMIKKRIEELEAIILPTGATASEKQASLGVRLFLVRSLNIFKKTLLFLSKEIVHDDPERYQYLLPNARKLFDIYCRFLHLLEKCPSEKNQALTCLAYQLLSYEYLDNKKLYNDLLTNNKELLLDESSVFPDFEHFNFTWYKGKSKLAFSTTRDVFTEVVIHKYSNPPIKIFMGQNIVKLYGAISEIGHGNPYFDNDTPGNERFWITTMSFMVTSYVIELIDVQFLGKTARKDFREWIKKVNDASRVLVILQSKKRVSANTFI